MTFLVRDDQKNVWDVWLIEKIRIGWEDTNTSLKVKGESPNKGCDKQKRIEFLRHLKQPILSKIWKIRLVFADSCHLHHRRYVLHVVVYFTSLYDCGTRSLEVQDVHMLLLFDHKCLQNIAQVYWNH